MDSQLPRRAMIKKTAAISSAAAIAAANWPLPALADDEELVAFTDNTAPLKTEPAQPGVIHKIDTRTLTDFYTPNEHYYVVQHYGQPEVDLSSYRLRVTGMVERPIELTLDEIKSRPRSEIDAGFECGGNQKGIFYGLASNARWVGISLFDLLRECGLKRGAKEIVFFGADEGTEEIRQRKVKQNFARSMSVNDALSRDNLLAYEMNGEPLPHFHGKPLRLLVPGWFGVANVKWLNQIHVQDDRFMGKFMARDYVTLRKYEVGGVERWTEESVTRMNLMSVIVRVTRRADIHRIVGFALNDGTPLKAVEVKVDDGPWQQATIDPRASKYSWKMFSYDWQGASAGEHTLVSRAIDINGQIQPTEAQVPEKATYWENPGQFPRKISVS